MRWTVSKPPRWLAIWMSVAIASFGFLFLYEFTMPYWALPAPIEGWVHEVKVRGHATLYLNDVTFLLHRRLPVIVMPLFFSVILVSYRYRDRPHAPAPAPVVIGRHWGAGMLAAFAAWLAASVLLTIYVSVTFMLSSMFALAFFTVTALDLIRRSLRK